MVLIFLHENHLPLIAQLVERRTVVANSDILRSLVRIRLEGEFFGCSLMKNFPK